MKNINADFIKEIGIRLKQLRKALKLSQVELAKIIKDKYFMEISEKSISRYESGFCLPKIDNLIVLSDYFGCSLDFIIFGNSTSYDNSYSWYDTLKRLNRLIISCVLIPNQNSLDDPIITQFNSTDKIVKFHLNQINDYCKNENYKCREHNLPSTLTIEALDKMALNFINVQEDVTPTKKRLDNIINLTKES